MTTDTPTDAVTTGDTTAKPKPRRAPAKKKAPAKVEFAPIVKDNGRLDHSACGHPRDMKGRTACRAFMAKADKK